MIRHWGKHALYVTLMTLWLSSMASAADLTGLWELNYPFEGERWTFEHPSESRFRADTPEFIFLVVQANFLMKGSTSGSQFQGITYFVINGVPLPGGIVRGTVVGDRLSGRVVDVFFGIYDLEGERQ